MVIFDLFFFWEYIGKIKNTLLILKAKRVPNKVFRQLLYKVLNTKYNKLINYNLMIK